jgi:hypothetical protein
MNLQRMQATGLQNFLDTIQAGKEVFRNWDRFVMERKIYAFILKTVYEHIKEKSGMV